MNKPTQLPVILEKEISLCKNCPNKKVTGCYSSDGWDRMEDWECSLAKRIISTGVEWHEENKIFPPDWCPLRKKKESKSNNHKDDGIW